MSVPLNAARSSLGGLLMILQLAVAAILIGACLLYWRGLRWNREAAAVPALAAEFQRKDVLMRALLFDAYQVNQKQRNSQLEALFQRLNFSIQNSPVNASPTPAPARPAAAR